jgi:rod shape determining protein RodA
MEKNVGDRVIGTSFFLGPRGIFRDIDWFLFIPALIVSLFGLATMHSFSGDNAYFEKQIVWIGIAIAVFFIASIPEYRFLRRTPVVVALYSGIIFLLLLIFLFGTIVKGAQNRFYLGFFAIQPADLAKLVLVVVLSKYFARRHIEIAHIRHILISGAYAFAVFALVFFQPDLGSAIIIACVWLGMVLVAGISWKHLLALFIATLIVLGGLWQYGLHPYQKQRILTFIHPLADIRGSGYNAYQSTVAIGSGELTGRGIGYGTQSKLLYLPEYQTDFIFAAYAEEWGFLGILILFGLYGIIIARTLAIAAHGSGNFNALFGAGVAVMFLSQFLVHVGMNLGLLPITGTTTPFMSYGGSHIVVEFAALGILMGMRRSARTNLQARDETELVGVI